MNAVNKRRLFYELGHHILYQGLKSIKGESLVLHEGLADYLVFARTNNKCLGETICPEGTIACVQKQCLRTADNDLNYEGVLPRSAHQKGQLFSALMWEIGEDIGQQETAALLHKSLQYLQGSSGYKDFIISLMSADKEVNAGKNACLIQDKLEARGFGNLMSSNSISCTDFGD